MRRAGKAAPSWLTEEHKRKILARYEQAVRKEEWMGVPHEVHHIIPIVGKCEMTDEHVVSGLHVPWNLEVVEQKENRVLGAIFFDAPTDIESEANGDGSLF